MGVSKVEMVREALRELGEASAQELATYLHQRYGVRIEARFIPILRASLRGQEVLEQARRAARATTQIAGNDLQSATRSDSDAATENP